MSATLPYGAPPARLGFWGLRYGGTYPYGTSHFSGYKLQAIVRTVGCGRLAPSSPPPCGIAFTGDSPPARTPPFSRSHWSIPRLAPALRIRPPTTASLSTSTSPSPQPPVSLPPSYQSKHLLCSQHQTFTSRRYLLAPNRQRTQTTTHTLTTASIRISAFAALTSPHLTVASPPAIPQ